MEFTHNGKQVNLMFGTDFIGIFCLELGHELSDIDKIKIENGSIPNSVLSIIADVIYSTAKAYALDNDTEMTIKQYQCAGVIINPNFDTERFIVSLNNSLTPNIPEGLPLNNAKKKPIGGK
jgi:hypothetical protein